MHFTNFNSINLNLDEVSQDVSDALVAQGVPDLPVSESKAVLQIRLTDDIAALPLPAINLELEVESDHNQICRPRVKSSKVLMLCSLAIHALGIAAVAWFSARHVPQILSKPEEIMPIQATLYYPAIHQYFEAPDESLNPIETALPEISAVEPHISEPEVNQQPLVKTVVQPKKANVSDAVETETTEPPPEVAAANEDTIAGSAGETTEQQSTGSQLERLNQALSSHLNSINAQQVQTITEAATANRHQQFYQQQIQGYQQPQAEPEMKIKKICFVV